MVLYLLDVDVAPAWLQFTDDMALPEFMTGWFFIVVAFALVWLAPNTAKLFRLHNAPHPDPITATPAVRPAVIAGLTAALIWLCALELGSAAPSEFLYFQF